MYKIITITSLLILISACSEIEYKTGTNFVSVENPDLYINLNGDKVLLINNKSKNQSGGKLLITDATGVNAIVEDGYLQIEFDDSVSFLPKNMSLQYRANQPHLCVECTKPFKTWRKIRAD